MARFQIQIIIEYDVNPIAYPTNDFDKMLQMDIESLEKDPYQFDTSNCKITGSIISK